MRPARSIHEGHVFHLRLIRTSNQVEDSQQLCSIITNQMEACLMQAADAVGTFKPPSLKLKEEMSEDVNVTTMN